MSESIALEPAALSALFMAIRNFVLKQDKGKEEKRYGRKININIYGNWQLAGFRAMGSKVWKSFAEVLQTICN